MARKSYKTILLAFSFAAGLAISFQNCSKSQFVTVDGEESLSSNSTGVRCTVDQVIDLSGKCVNNSDISQACTINGQLLGNGNSVQVYPAASVPAGSQCVPSTTTCRNGSLVGSSSTALSCQVQAPPSLPGSGSTPTPTPNTPSTPLSCKFNGMNIAIGQTVTAYAASSAATCLYQQRVCNEKGELSGTYQFPSCQKLPAGATCSFNGQPLKPGDMVQAYKVPSSSSAADCQPETRICQSNGTLTGSNAYESCQLTNTAPTCNPLEVLATLRTYTQLVLTDKYSIAKACIDELTPTVEGSYPESVPGSPGHYLRFMNTCGNRFCKQKQNGFISGRVVENNEAGYLVECRTNQAPPETRTLANSACNPCQSRSTFCRCKTPSWLNSVD